MPSNSQPVTAEQVREWQLNPVSQVLYQKLKLEVEQAKGTRPFTDGEPNKTYSDLLTVMVKEEVLENLIPLFNTDPKEVAEQLNDKYE